MNSTIYFIMRKLNLNEMSKLNGGAQISASDVVCGGVGLMFGFVTTDLGLLVGVGCSAYWDDIEANNPILITW